MKQYNKIYNLSMKKTTILILFLFIIFGSFSYAQASTKTLYAWVKDAAGNVSNSLNDTVDITLPASNTYYISPSGSDATGNGSITTPWASLYKACNSVTTSGKTIHVNAGTYIETNECSLSVGVNIEGEGTSSIIKSHYIVVRNGNIIHGAIALVSATEGTNGNQSISSLKLDGDNLQGSIGIAIKNRSNVNIHDMTIVDFYINGVTMTGAAGGTYSVPTTYSTGFQFYNNIVMNCGDTPGTWDDGGCLQISGTQDSLIHDNTFNNTFRTAGHNGFSVFIRDMNKGLKFYNNKSYRLDNNGTSYNFHMECWTQAGGNEIYNNEFYEGDIAVDLAGFTWSSGSYGFTTKVYNNLFYSNVVNTTRFRAAVHVEARNISDVYVYDNHFIGVPFPFDITEGNPVGDPTVKNNINFYRNLIKNPANGTGVNYYNLISLASSYSGTTYSNVNIYNNTILSSMLANNNTTAIKIQPATGSTFANFNIKNNIFLNHKNGTAINIVNNSTFDGLHIDNNILFGNGGSNNPTLSGNAVTNYSFLNNLKVDPIFISSTDFHLQPISQAINAGINVGLPYNGSAPDIGAYETGGK